jgi:hypothetical protein
MEPIYESLATVEEYTKQWSNRYMCKWAKGADDTIKDIEYAINFDKPLSYTRFGDGELIFLKEYFKLIKDDPYYINLCNANRHIPHVSGFYHPSDNIEFYADRYHYYNMYNNYMINRWGVYDKATQLNIIKVLGESLINSLQTSTHIGISQPNLSHIGDYVLYKHSYTPHIELFAACGVDFNRLTDVAINLDERIANPYKFKEMIKGKPIHIFTSNEYELKNVTKLHEVLETEITYTNLSPRKKDWRSHSFANHDFLLKRCNDIGEQIVLYGLGYGAKHITSHLSSVYGKVALDLGSTLDGWAGRITRPHHYEKSYMVPVTKDKQIKSYPWDQFKSEY